MKFMLDPTLNLTREAALLLPLAARGEGGDPLAARRAQKGAGPLSPEQERDARELNALTDSLFARLALTGEERALLTPDMAAGGEPAPRLSSVLFPILQANGRPLEETAQAVAAADEGALRAAFYAALLCDESESPPERDFAAFAAFVLGQPWPDAAKCHVLSVFTDFHAAFARALPAVRRMTALLEQAQAALAPRLAAWHAQMAALLAREDDPAVAQLLEIVPDVLHGETCAVRPQLADYFSLSLSLCYLPGGEATALLLAPRERVCLAAGLLAVPAAAAPGGARMTESETLAALKMLSDKSKLDILRALREGPCYGAQLARRLSLSPATISHHMAGLLSLPLVRVEARENKFYYSLNTARAGQLLDDLRALLLG